jgi:hypothetical protein
VFGPWIRLTAAAAAYRRLLTRGPTDRDVALDDALPPFEGDGRRYGPVPSLRLQRRGPDAG